MTVIEILNGTNKDISENIGLLEKVYFKETGRKVCRTCPSDVQYMILSLKNVYNMTQFKFKRHAAIYKNKKGDKTTISNGTMTDEKAIEFLKTNPERITLFAEYPSNWETLIIDGAKQETEEEKQNRLAIEAELKASNPTKAKLMKMSLKDLRSTYPEIKGTSIKVFVDKVMKLAPKPEAPKPEAPKPEAKTLEEEAIAEAKAVK